MPMQVRAIPVPDDWQALRPHPLIDLVEVGAGVNLEAMAGRMRRHGYDPDEAVVLHEGMVLDNRYRLLAAIRAGVVPAFRELVGKGALAYARSGRRPAAAPEHPRGPRLFD